MKKGKKKWQPPQAFLFLFLQSRKTILYNIESIFCSFTKQQINLHGDFASSHAVLTSQITQLLKGQVSKGFASCPVPQKEV